MRKNLKEYAVDEKVTDFFIVKSCILRTSNKGGEYMDMVIADNSGEMPAKVWDLSRPETSQVREIQGREVIKVRGIITEWNGEKQMKIIQLRKAVPEDDVDVSALVRTAPMSGDEMFNLIFAKAEQIKDPDFKALTVAIMKENETKLKYFPAASRNHHAIKGGLLYHVYRMLLNAEGFCQVYPSLSKDLLVCGVILHDIAKLEEIDSDELGMADAYTFEGQMLGHIAQGIKFIDRAGRKLGMSKEKMIMVEHMILSHHYEPEFGSPKKPMFPEAEMLHYLDDIDAKMYDMENALKGIEPGNFSQRIWSMDNRRMYKPLFSGE